MDSTVSNLPFEVQNNWELSKKICDDGEAEVEKEKFDFEKGVNCTECKKLPRVTGRAGSYRFWCTCGKSTETHERMSEALCAWLKLNETENYVR